MNKEKRLKVFKKLTNTKIVCIKYTNEFCAPLTIYNKFVINSYCKACKLLNRKES